MDKEIRKPVPKVGHGGVREGQGRSPQYEEGAMVVSTANLTRAQADRLRDLGGAEWLRTTLDRDRHASAGTEKTRDTSQSLVPVSFRITNSQRFKLRELGGAQWLRNVLTRSIRAAERHAKEG